MELQLRDEDFLGLEMPPPKLRKCVKNINVSFETKLKIVGNKKLSCDSIKNLERYQDFPNIWYLRV